MRSELKARNAITEGSRIDDTQNARSTAAFPPRSYHFVVDLVQQARYGGEDRGSQQLHVGHQQLDVAAEETDLTCAVDEGYKDEIADA